MNFAVSLFFFFWGFEEKKTKISWFLSSCIHFEWCLSFTANIHTYNNYWMWWQFEKWGEKLLYEQLKDESTWWFSHLIICVQLLSSFWHPLVCYQTDLKDCTNIFRKRINVKSVSNFFLISIIIQNACTKRNYSNCLQGSRK